MWSSLQGVKYEDTDEGLWTEAVQRLSGVEF